MIFSYLQGLMLGLGLCVAIGAQNAFVLKQGLKQQHVFAVFLVCSISDSVLIMCGVNGFAQIVEKYPLAIQVAKYLGASFLLVYGLQHFISAIKGNHSLKPSDEHQESLLRVILICLAFTWLNPHVYLDTVVLIGAISLQYSQTKFYFALGAMTASWLFFYSLAFGAKLLLPYLQHPRSWKILDNIIAIIMLTIALSLLLSA